MSEYLIRQAMKDHGVYDDDEEKREEDPDREYEWSAGK